MRSVSLSGVSCTLEGRKAVDGISMTIQPGEIVCFLGPSGCGKTTSLRLIGGIVKPDGGRIDFDGETVSDSTFVLPPEKRKIGFLFQDFALFPHLSVTENVLFGLTMQKHKNAEARALLMLELTGVRHLADRYPPTLSGGEQQRVALARALAPAPGLVLMDEPFSNLDPPLRDDMRRLTVSLLRGRQDGISPATGIVVTHDAADAMFMADRIAVMSEGRIIQCDAPDVLFDKPATPLVGRLLGPLNEWQGRVEDNLVESPIGRFPVAGFGGQARVMVRPCDISATDAGSDGFAARIVSARRSGNAFHLDIALSDDTVWEVVWPEKNLPKIGDEVKFHIKPEAVMIFGV